MPKITLNGEEYEVDQGKTVIQVADDVGVRIPRYCYHLISASRVAAGCV